jgi:outer membrane protein
VHTGELIVHQAEENYELAAGRYNAGVDNPIELADAEVTLVNARTSHIQALYDSRLARTGIERAIGVAAAAVWGRRLIGRSDHSAGWK